MTKYQKLLRYITQHDVKRKKDEKTLVSRRLIDRLGVSYPLSKSIKSRITKSDITTYDLYDLLQSTFEDNWTIDSRYLTVYYPEILITSENGNTHTIREVYIRWKITSNYSYPYPELFKAVFTRAELAVNYLHSHVKHDDVNSWSGQFCWGTYLKTQFSKLSTINECFRVEWLFHQVLNTHLFLQQESIAGRPYVAMSNIVSIRNKDYYTPYINYDNFDLSKLEIYNIRSISDNRIDFDYNRNELLENHPDYELFLCYNNQYALDSEPIIRPEIVKETGYYFGKKKIIRKVIQEEFIEPAPMINSNIIGHLDSFINKYVNDKKYEIAKSYGKLYHQV